MNPKIVFRISFLLTLLSLGCMGIKYYIFPLPSHDGVWTLTPIFSAISGSWTEDIYTGYHLPFLHYYLKLPYYYLMGNNIYGPFILNIFINVLYICLVWLYAKKHHISSEYTWLMLALFMSCNVFTSLRPEHLINLFLLGYFLYHSSIKSIVGHAAVSLLFMLIHPAAGLFAVLFNVTKLGSSSKIKYALLSLVAVAGIVFYFTFTEQFYTLLYSLKSRYLGNFWLGLFTFCKSCFLIHIYYFYLLFRSENKMKEALQWLSLVLLALLLGKDYYFDYVVVFVLYKCISSPKVTTHPKWVLMGAVMSVLLFPVRYLYIQLDGQDEDTNLKPVLNKIADLTSHDSTLYSVPMEFALPALGNRKVVLQYHNLETDQYQLLSSDTCACVLITESWRSEAFRRFSKTPVKQWIPPAFNQRYCLIEIAPLTH